MSLRLIALDLSLQSPGYAWTTTSGEPTIDVITVPARSDDPQQRIHAIRKMLRSLLTIKPHLVVVEGIFAGKNIQTAIKLGKLHGVIEQDLWEASVPYVHIPNQRRAMYATGNGHALKPAVIQNARYTYGRFVGGATRIRTSDDADALIMYAMAADYYGEPLVGVGQTRRRALEDIAWPIIKIELPAPPVALPGASTLMLNASFVEPERTLIP